VLISNRNPLLINSIGDACVLFALQQRVAEASLVEEVDPKTLASPYLSTHDPSPRLSTLASPSTAVNRQMPAMEAYQGL